MSLCKVTTASSAFLPSFGVQCDIEGKLFCLRYQSTTELEVTKNLVHIESIDVGAVPLVSSHSYVQSVGFRLYRPLFLLPDAGRFAIGDPRSAPPNQCAAEVAAWACSPEDSGPALLDVAYAPLVRLALCPRHRQAGNGDRLASQGIPALLDMEEPPRAAWETGVGERDSRRSSAG